MPITLDEIVEEVSQLPADVVAELVDRIMLARHGGMEPEIEEAWTQEARCRLAEIKSGEVAGISEEQMKARLRQEPLPLKLLRKIDTLSLSYREKLFCLLMASGHTQAVIAERMVIRKYTAIAYRRHVYTKLSVNNRAELMSKLLAL